MDDLHAELDKWRQTCDRLQAENNELRKNVDQKRNPTNAPDGVSGDSPAPPSRLQRLSGLLATSEAALHACLVDSGPAVDFEKASEEELSEMRVIRRCAAIMAMRGMALMQTYHGALKPEWMRRVHAAAWRPREVGGADASADSVVPAISRLSSAPLMCFLASCWLVGAACQFSILFDRFEAGSIHEWVACGACALLLPSIVFIGASLNAKTLRSLMTEFQTLYILANGLGCVGLLLFLFRDHPAKMVAFGLMVPSFTLSGFLDARAEGGRLQTSRGFFAFNIAGLLLWLVLVSLKLGAFTDYTFETSTFTFIASSMASGTITTLLVFGCKNLGLSFYRPGSLVVLAWRLASPQ